MCIYIYIYILSWRKVFSPDVRRLQRELLSLFSIDIIVDWPTASDA